MRLGFIKNVVPAPNMGKKYCQDIEPAGWYFTPIRIDSVLSVPEGSMGPHYVRGIVDLKNPLVLDLSPMESPNNWKVRLQLKYKKKGRALSLAIKAAGYDSILVRWESIKIDDGFSEAVLLTC